MQQCKFPLKPNPGVLGQQGLSNESSHHLSLYLLPGFVAAPGADSEYSLGSGILLSDSRETSRAPSSIHSAIFHDQGGRDYGERSRASSLQEVDWELNGGERARGDEPQHGASSRKRLDVTGQEWGVVAEGEE